MPIISKQIEVDYGHTLPEHSGFCNQIHGHRAKIIAFVQGDVKVNSGSDKGMIIDFGIIKKLMMQYIHSRIDHGFAVWEYDKTTMEFIAVRNNPDKVVILSEPPTAEALSKWAFHRLVYHIAIENLLLTQIHWHETPNSIAYYTIQDYLKDFSEEKQQREIFGKEKWEFTKLTEWESTGLTGWNHNYRQLIEMVKDTKDRINKENS